MSGNRKAVLIFGKAIRLSTVICFIIAGAIFLLDLKEAQFIAIPLVTASLFGFSNLLSWKEMCKFFLVDQEKIVEVGKKRLIFKVLFFKIFAISILIFLLLNWPKGRLYTFLVSLAAYVVLTGLTAVALGLKKA